MNLFRTVLSVALLFFLLCLGTGCGGINASHSISPIDFFLPGLIQNKPETDKTQPVASHIPGQQEPAVTL